MGAWATAIFSDDLAADVRGDWRGAIIDGQDPAVLTRALVERYGHDGGDPSDTIVFWLALAAVQMESGRLDPAVRDRALGIIEAGGDLARWREQDPSLVRQRERVLAGLAAKLRGPQAEPKRLRRTTPPGVRFDVGDAIRLRTDSGLAGVIAIVVAHTDGWPRGTVDPVFELVVWEEDRAPTAAELAQQPALLRKSNLRRPDLRSAVPHLFAVLTPTRRQRFGSDVGEIVARGVARARPGELKNNPSLMMSRVNWRGLVQFVGGPAFKRDLELTRREITPG